MNETLKGVAHIGAELAAAKADLQREMERHRKTWTQLEQVKGLLRDIEEFFDAGGISPGYDIEMRMAAALSQQAEPVRCEYCDGTGDVHRADGEWIGECKECGAAEPAPAQDERGAFEAWVMQHNTAVREDYDDTDENAPEDIRLDRQGGVYIWANAEAAWFAWKARSAQTAPRCQCCGYLVTDSEHRGCLRAAAPQPERWDAMCGDWRETSVAIHGERSGYIACGIPEAKARAIINAHNAGLPGECAALSAQGAKP